MDLRGPVAVRRLAGSAGVRPRSHSGVHSPRLQNAGGAAFLADGEYSGASAQATRTARERRRIRRPADHHGRGLARRVRARAGRRSRCAPRRKPDYCLNIGVTWPGLVALGTEERCPGAVVQVIWRVHRRSRATSGAGRRNWAELARELDCRFREGARSRPGDAARRQPGSDGGLQRPGARLACRRKCLSRNLAPRRDGAHGDARWQTRAHCQGSFRVYRRNQHARHSRRPGTISPRSPAALRAMALRLAGRSGELRRTRAARTRPERQLCSVQEG